MVIRKMNNMFTRHGRWMFAIITLFIIVSFVGFLTPGFSSIFSFGGSNANSAGLAFGKDVSINEVRDQASRDAIIISLSFGVDMSNSQVYEAAEKNAFFNICALRAASRMGIVVSDEELAEYIEKMPRFQGANGKFDLNKFNDYAKSDLKNHGVKVSTLEQAIRESLIKQKLMAEISGVTIVTPDEILSFFNMIREKYDVSVAEFKGSALADKIKVSDEDVKKYYDANRKKYLVPEKYQIRTVEFAYDDFAVKADVSESDIKNYYEQNKDEYTKMENGKPVTTPLAKVKAEISKKLIGEKARKNATELAQQFAVESYNETQGKPETLKKFLAFAGAKGHKVHTYGWVDKNTVALGKRPMEPEVLAELSGIFITAPVSNPVPGRDCAFVIFLEAKEEAKMADFNDVKDQVKHDLQMTKAIALAREQARHAATEIAQQKNSLKVFKKLVPNATNIEPFDIMSPPYTQLGGLITALAEKTPEGAISEVKDTPEGAIFVYVKDRTLPGSKDFEAVKPMMTTFYTQMKQNSANYNFNLWLQSKCKVYEQRGN